jgi:pentatricopeptide repeat protein
MTIQPEIEQAVRRGDLYGIIIEFHFEKREYEKCLEYLKKMKERGIVIAPYVDK